MVKRRRATDHAPLSQIVTRDNLTDRLDSVAERTAGHWTLDDERWEAHKELATERWLAHHEVHIAVAESLRDYKRDANEWRQTLTDLRSTFMGRAEYLAEHKALEAKMHGEITANTSKMEALDSRLDIVERAIQSINDREVTTRGVLSNGRNLILLALAIMGGLISLALYLRPA
jgi:hypothetical protein